MTKVQAILYLQNYRYTVDLDEEKIHTISNEYQAALHVPFIAAADQLTIQWQETWTVTHNEQAQVLPLNQPIQLELSTGETATLLLTPVKKAHIFDVLDKTEVVLSTNKGATIELEQTATALETTLIMQKKAEHWVLTRISGELFINNHRFTGTEYVIDKGDEFSFLEHTLKLFPHEIHATEGTVVASELCEIYNSRYDVYEDYPDFHRSPRIIYREPEKKLTINAPSDPQSAPNDQLLKIVLPPVLMLMVTVGMAFFRSNGLFVLASAATTVVTLIFSITGYFKARKDHKQSLLDREASYKKYLINKAVELHQVNQEQKQGQLYHYPSVSELLEMAKTYSPRIYEKTPLHFDFLFYRLGLGSVLSSSDISYSNKERGKETDALEKSGYELYTKSLELNEMPIIANLMHGPVGYIGPRSLVLEQLHLLVNQLSVFHSYHDLQFISIFPETEKDQWEWMRWMPHAKMQDVNVRGFVYNQRSRDQVLNSLNQILKNRKNALEENRNSRESTLFTPHYVVMITDEKLILDHVIMEFFNEDPSEFGCSVIFVEDVMSSLSDNIKTVIDIRDRNTGVLLLEEGQLKNIPFQLDHFPATFDKEQLPRLLAPLNHLQNLKSSIPEAVTFLEMYGIETFDEFNVTQRWAEHSPHKTLAVPLGLRGKDDIVYLNLHEKAHGPHGLVAGTTGSGKSEIVQSYILSLAVNFHPYDVAFLLIDYKGGGMANLFRNLPHLLGSITNLDGAQSMRALISINAELKRRQRLFSENNVNHINQYQKLYKNGDVSEPMPHLFLISDEFAELKAEQPEFMKELVSTARIGRSLGIHLILATQKPSGVVNDQIWSNSKFKLALKVADRADSMEMLKTPDAAEITQAGRAYLQVGNNEIYELFQSAWSGADYQPDKDDQQIEDHTIYLINDLGQYEILSEDLSGLENAEEVKQIPTELDAIIDGIHAVAEKEQITPLPRPWLPPLEERIIATALHPVDFKEEWLTEKQALVPVLGVVDVPSMQAQDTLRLNMTQEGHMAVYSSPGYGKSTLMQTVVMDLARVHNPERLHVYLLDFGTNGLLPLKKLPHVADTMGIDEEEKIGKFARRMSDEMKRRKKLLSEYSVASLEMYERASGKEEPILLILLDGFEGMKGAKFEEILEKVITQVAREGAGIGVHLLLSAGRQNSLRMTLSSNIKTQIVLKMIDDSEPRAIVGRTTLTIDDLPGRGLIKMEEPELFQTALPTAGGDTLQIIEAIQEEVTQMDAHWTGERPEPIPMVPEVLTAEYFENMTSVKKDMATPNLFPIGIDFEEVQSVSWDSYRSNLLYAYGKIQEAERFGKQLIAQLLYKKYTVVLFDTQNSPLYELHDKVSVLATEKEQYQDLLGALKIRSEEREAQYAEAREKESNLLPTEYYRSLEPMFVLLSNVGKIVSELDTTSQSTLVKLLADANQVGIYFVSITDIFELSKGYDEISKLLKRADEAIITVRLNDQTIFSPSNKSYKEAMLAEDEAYYLMNNVAYPIKQCK